MIDEWLIGKGLEGSGHGLTEIRSQHFPRKTEEKPRNPVSIAGVLAEIRTWQLKWYHQTSLFGQRDIFILMSYLGLSLQVVSFPIRFHTVIMYVLHISSMHATSSAHLAHPKLIVLITSGKGYKSLLHSFLHLPVISSSLRANILLRALSSHSHFFILLIGRMVKFHTHTRQQIIFRYLR
jgi:hypothetical protein